MKYPHMATTLILCIALAILQLSSLSSAAIYCQDENGNDVDYFVVYKIPKITSEKRSPFAKGLNYAFMTGKRVKDGVGSATGWQLSSKLVTDDASIFAQTLAPMYKTPTSQKAYTYFLYSDAPPDEKGNSYRAHSKGVVVMDGESGFWLSHSIPNFPPTFEKEYKYPDTGADNGQTAICISFKTDEEGKDVINHLMFMKPNVYSQAVTKVVRQKVPNTSDLESKTRIKETSIISDIRSVAGTKFITVSRSNKAEGDLWSESVAPYVKTNLLVETWRRGAGGPLQSNCNGTYAVHNIQEMNLKFADKSTSGKFMYTEDHSKWGVSESKSRPIACVGDINRMESQFKRGGGTICVESLAIWSAFKDSVTDVQACPN